MDRRAAFRQRIVDYNAVLERVCAAYARCEFDGRAGFNTDFERRHVATQDYFHPSIEGQALIAKVAWTAVGY